MQKTELSFLQKTAPGIVVFLVGSIGVSLASNWSDDIRDAEILRGLITRVAILEGQARHDSRFAERGEKIEARLNHLQEEVQNLRVLIAGTRPNR